MTTPSKVLALWKVARGPELTVEVNKKSPRLILLHFTHRLDVTETTDARDIDSAWKNAGRRAGFAASDMAQEMEKADQQLLNPSGMEQLIVGNDYSRSAKDRLEAVNGAIIMHFYCDVVAEEDLPPELIEKGIDVLRQVATVK